MLRPSFSAPSQFACIQIERPLAILAGPTSYSGHPAPFLVWVPMLVKLLYPTDCSFFSLSLLSSPPLYYVHFFLSELTNHQGQPLIRTLCLPKKRLLVASSAEGWEPRCVECSLISSVI